MTSNDVVAWKEQDHSLPLGTVLATNQQCYTDELSKAWHIRSAAQNYQEDSTYQGTYVWYDESHLTHPQ